VRKGKSVSGKIVADDEEKGFESGMVDRFRLRTRYFTDSGIIGSKEFNSAVMGCVSGFG
jgi:putative transposase